MGVLAFCFSHYCLLKQEEFKKKSFSKIKKTFNRFTIFYLISAHLRNEFNFWKVHGIMNTSGLVQSK